MMKVTQKQVEALALKCEEDARMFGAAAKWLRVKAAIVEEEGTEAVPDEDHELLHAIGAWNRSGRVVPDLLKAISGG